MSNAKGSEHMLNRVMTKDNIALAALLETKPTVWEQSQLPPEIESQHQQILVCTAHIHWDPEFCDVKLIQVSRLSNYKIVPAKKFSVILHNQENLIFNFFHYLDDDANGSAQKTHFKWNTK